MFRACRPILHAAAAAAQALESATETCQRLLHGRSSNHFQLRAHTHTNVKVYGVQLSRFFPYHRAVLEFFPDRYWLAGRVLAARCRICIGINDVGMITLAPFLDGISFQERIQQGRRAPCVRKRFAQAQPPAAPIGNSSLTINLSAHSIQNIIVCSEWSKGSA